MVNLGNFFGAPRGRVVDPSSDRQLAMACKAQGLVFDKDTKQCRQPLKRGRAPVPGAGPSVASLRSACKAQGLVLDMDNKQCRASRRGAGLPAARVARMAKRGDAMTVAQMREMCKAAGKVLDKDTKQCRDPLSKGRKSGLEAAYARGSLFFGARGVDPMSARQLAMACKARGLVLDKDTKQCRQPARRGRAPGAGPSVASLRAACKAQGLVLDGDSKQCRASRRGAGLPAARTARAAGRVLAGPTQKDMMAMCKAQGLVFDRATKQCRPKMVRGSALEQAYKRGSLFFGMQCKNKFGVNRPAAHQRAGVVYHGPASSLTRPDYGIIGPVQGPITGPGSFQVRGSVISPAMQKQLGVLVPKIPDKKNLPGVPTPKKVKFGTYARGPKGSARYM